MSARLEYTPLDNLGLNGLNVQANPAAIDQSWLTEADNIVLRESGRISFRKGVKQNILKTTAKIGAIGETSTGVVVAAVGTNMYTVDFTAPNSPWTAAYATGGSASDWQMIDFNRELYCVQSGHIPIELDGTTWAALPATSGYNAPAGVTTFNPSCGMGFYGRLWVGGITEEKDVVYYSDTLNAHKWSSGAAGAVDLKTVWGTDDIVAIAPFYGKLVIFGKSNIVIYGGPSEPSTMVLDEVIRGIGCVSRDSIQSVGDDLYFLSSTGVRSLSRTTEKDNVPLQDLSLTIKDTIIRNISQSSNAKALYVENEGTYVLSFVDLNITYVFDIKHETPSGTPRITTWSFDDDRNPSSMAYTDSKGFLIGQIAGSIATYEGYYDKDYVSGGTYTSASYTGTFKTTWIDLGQGAMASILKKIKAVISGGSGTTIGVKWYKDFSIEPSNTTNFLLNPGSSGTASLFGATTSLFGTSKFAPIFGMKEYNIPLTGSAKYLQLEMSGETNGSTSSLQDMTLLYKQGKIR
jgi:hypothetical protein